MDLGVTTLLEVSSRLVLKTSARLSRRTESVAWSTRTSSRRPPSLSRLGLLRLLVKVLGELDWLPLSNVLTHLPSLTAFFSPLLDSPLLDSLPLTHHLTDLIATASPSTKSQSLSCQCRNSQLSRTTSAPLAETSTLPSSPSRMDLSLLGSTSSW